MLRLIIFRYYKNIIFDFVCDISLYNYTVDNTLSHSGNDKDTCNRVFYSEMTAFTDQYSLPNTCFDIGQLQKEHTNVKRGTSGDIFFKYKRKIISNTFIIVQ